MFIGSRTHDYGKQPIRDLAPLLKSEGIDAAQLVLPKGFQEINAYEEVTMDQLERIRRSFEENQVQIHILGCYMDLGNPDSDIRRKAVETFKTCLTYGKLLNAKIVGTETAYPHLNREEKKLWYPHMVDSVSRLVEEAERVDMDLALEPVYWHPLEDLETTARVFEKMNSKRMRMIFDPANVLANPECDQNTYWKEWLDVLGEKIEAIHMKDFVEGPNKEYRPVDLGEGVMNYQEIIRWLKQEKPDIVIVREELRPETAQKDIAYMRKLWELG